MSKISLGVLLLLVWLLLWGEVSVANVGGGVAVIALLYLIFPIRRPNLPRTYLHPVASVHLLGYVAVQVVWSSVLLAREIVTPRAHTRSRILTVPMRTSSQALLTVIADLTALTPGTMTVAVSSEPPCVTLHALLVKGSPDAVASLRRIEELTVRAFGTRDDYVALDEVVERDLPPVIDDRDPTHRDTHDVDPSQGGHP